VAAGLAPHPRVPRHLRPKDWAHRKPGASIGLRMTNEIAAKRFFGSIQIVLSTLEAFFAGMTPAQALEWAAAA
jgi:hypothetical protein